MYIIHGWIGFVGAHLPAIIASTVHYKHFQWATQDLYNQVAADDGRARLESESDAGTGESTIADYVYQMHTTTPEGEGEGEEEGQGEGL